MSLSEFFGRSAATRCFSVRAVQLPRCFSCGQGSAAFRSFSGQQASRRCQVGGHHLPTVSYGPFQTKLPFISEYTIFAHLDRLVSLHFVPGRCSSNSYSAAFIYVSCAMRRIRFLFQTFSRNDPPGQAPPTQGRSVFKKRNFKRNNERPRAARSPSSRVEWKRLKH